MMGCAGSKVGVGPKVEWNASWLSKKSKLPKYPDFVLPPLSKINLIFGDARVIDAVACGDVVSAFLVLELTESSSFFSLAVLNNFLGVVCSKRPPIPEQRVKLLGLQRAKHRIA